VGRLKRSRFPSLAGGGHTFGGGAGAGLLAAMAGRLLCDTYLGARELLREARLPAGAGMHSHLPAHAPRAPEVGAVHAPKGC